jgi:hypothetical protein
MPPPVRDQVARLVRRTGWTPRPRYRYESDGLATVHFNPFDVDPEFSSLYREMAADWFVEFYADVRWRMWLLTRFARECSGLDGSFAEFGVYRAGCAFMVLALTGWTDGRTMYLFDTFSGIPHDHLAPAERERGLGGILADTSVEYVARRLQRFAGRFEICAGDVFDTIPAVETGPLALAHIDMNTAAPTRHVLEYTYERLVPGGVIVFDDYGYGGEDTFEERATIDGFFAHRPESVIALPTGQGFVTRR